MSSRIKYRTQKNQQGLVLLVLVIIIALAFITYSVSDLSITKVHLDQSKNTSAALKEAKQAVINYAVTYSDIPVKDTYGLFPNPEALFYNKYGNMTPSWGLKNRNIIGWFPWRSLGLSALKDESGTCLFYAVSGTYKLGSSISDMVNEDSIGMFQVVDNATTPNVLQDQVVALVIAAGEALAGRPVRNPLFVNSNCGHDYGNVSAYLEGDGNTDNSTVSGSADTIDTFIHATETSKNAAIPYNDKFLTITREEIWGPIVKRSDFKKDMESLTQALAICAANYANLADNTGRKLPWPTKMNLAPLAPLVPAPLDYRNNASYDDDNASEGYAGRYPYNIDDSNNAIDPSNTKLTEDTLFNIPGMCTNLGNDWDGNIMNLKLSSSKYRQLWNNWKDHFFYTISKSYAPDNSGLEKACTDSGASCITVNSTKYAGAVIFSGSRLAGYTRTDKTKLEEYLEDGKSTVFTQEQASKTGKETYIYTDPAIDPDTVNDIMYCIKDELAGTALGVVACI